MRFLEAIGERTRQTLMGKSGVEQLFVPDQKEALDNWHKNRKAEYERLGTKVFQDGDGYHIVIDLIDRKVARRGRPFEARNSKIDQIKSMLNGEGIRYTFHPRNMDSLHEGIFFLKYKQ